MSRRNADENLRRLEREFRAAPSEDLRRRLSAEYLRLVPLTAEQLVFVIPELMSGLNEAQRRTLLLGVMGVCGERVSMELVKSAARPLNWFPDHVAIGVCPRGHAREPDDAELFEVHWLDLRFSRVVAQFESTGETWGKVEGEITSLVDSPELTGDDDPSPVFYCTHPVDGAHCGAMWPVGRLEYE